MFKAALVLLAALLSALPGFSQNQSSSCLRYEPSVLQIRGILTRKTFPGPPNYESIRKGDKPEIYFFLNPPLPFCVEQSMTEPELNPQLRGIKSVQLVLQPDDYKQYANLVGKKVIATGTLFGAHTAHHRTPVLLTVKQLEPEKK